MFGEGQTIHIGQGPGFKLVPEEGEVREGDTSLVSFPSALQMLWCLSPGVDPM